MQVQCEPIPIGLEDTILKFLSDYFNSQKILPIKNWGGLDADFDWQIPQVEHWLKVSGFTNESTPYENVAD